GCSAPALRHSHPERSGFVRVGAPPRCERGQHLSASGRAFSHPGRVLLRCGESCEGRIWSPPSLQGISFDGKSRLSVVYPASVCSTVLRASMSSRHVSSLSSLAACMTMTLLRFSIHRFDLYYHHLLIAFATWGSALPLG